MRILLSLLSLIGFRTALADASCQCALFLNNEHWLPQRVAFNSTSRYNVDCFRFGEATEQCKNFCYNEMQSMKDIIRNGVSMQDKFPPRADLPCVAKHTSTLSFSRACGSQNYVLTAPQYGPPVCCDQNALVQWCSYDDSQYYQENILEARKLNLEKSENDIENNEIDVMEKPIKERVKVSSVLVNTTSPSPTSWLESFTGYFGYNNFLDVVKNVDIFSLPGRIQGAIKDYKDEISMGRCYMEFTTFKLFTKQENPFADFLRRKKRATSETDAEYEQVENMSVQPRKHSQFEALEALIQRFSERYGRTVEGRQQSSLINTVMKLFTHFVTSQGESNGGGASSLISLVAPLLSQITAKPNEALPISGGADNGQYQDSSQLPMMAMQLLGNAFESYFTPTPNVTNKEKAPYPPQSKPNRPASGPGIGSGIGTILNMLSTGANASPPSPVRRKPQPNSTRPDVPVKEEEPKSFANMLLDLIRPVFISIIGNTPGEGGVESIRRVSVLSTNGRVDNTLKDEVDSPFFCFKRYAVNKAWTLTEVGVNGLVAKFTPEERETMRRALS